MYKRILCFGTLIVAIAVTVLPAHAQQVACGQRTEIVASLGGKYGEIRRGGGLAGPGAIFELFASERTGTWTILRTGANGLSCVMAVGDGWQTDATPATQVGDPA